jgi:SAM-dependent methyltransferase
MDDVREEVRDHYARAALAFRDVTATSSCCGGPTACADGCGDDGLGAELYPDAARDVVPDTALKASLGCGNPTAVADLHEGDTVLDLGSGGGLDAILSARRVGSSGKVYGLDMTEEMLALALENRRKAGVGNVEFLKGYIEDVPLPANTVDVVISNCVINLSAEKSRVFAEMHRVLKPGGRVGITDMVAADDLSPQERAERGSYTGCVAGALSFAEYDRGLREAGFEDVTVTPTHEPVPGIFSAVVKATRPPRTG